MSTALPTELVNRLIDGLPRVERAKMLQACEPIELIVGSTLCEADQPIEYAYFPLTGFISLVSHLNKHKSLEMGLIGDEGMLGVTLVLEVETAPITAVVRGPGIALRMSAAQLQQELRALPVLLRRLHRYLYVLMLHLSQSATCTHFHEIEPRLARWLLMAHDRAHSDHFHLTHEFLGTMLGVRRSGITIAACALQNRELIHYTRGEIQVLDRAGLEAASCGCYALAVNSYARILD